MIIDLWHDFLYQPLFNLLVWIYNNWAEQNLGWAIIYLTILLRVALLPFTVVTERDRLRNEALYEEIKRIDKEFSKDQILKKEEIRRVMKQRHIYPWAKFVSLGIQAVVFVLLYQVFLRGITGDKILKILYPEVDFPGRINTMFYGFDLARTHDTLSAGIVGLWLAAEIYITFRKRPARMADLMYFLLFPLFVFFALWFLPMVKSLFILTSLAFSAIIHQFMKLVFRPKKKAGAH
ncbi:MAG: Membrane protein insertase YidC [Candidatus Magasanikbacteria bacterium GW2011_GWA2_56_11]|uniref:Membrane protein insertase YidC n=1 Tax=Candidatus Magasanikbacteria bacterium GW2011_GWA2_56_11 TaxID=1619044 RepID=A0A0G2B7K7_9BACT|nr:MAG: Membrane protein insertase YidC [Candidatus Magasanikbacteria bacterium GW2011_GWA2_56_11]